VITKHILELMGGSIEAECEFDVGCAFHMELQLADTVNAPDKKGS